MPKMKTHKGVKKRFRATAKKKIKHRRAGTSHLNSRLTSKRRRDLRGTGSPPKAGYQATARSARREQLLSSE